jgi:hypothetical protein
MLLLLLPPPPPLLLLLLLLLNGGRLSMCLWVCIPSPQLSDFMLLLLLL